MDFGDLAQTTVIYEFYGVPVPNVSGEHKVTRGRVPCFEMGGDFSSLPWLPGHWDSAVLRRVPLRLRRSLYIFLAICGTFILAGIFLCGELTVVTG